MVRGGDAGRWLLLCRLWPPFLVAAVPLTSTWPSSASRPSPIVMAVAAVESAAPSVPATLTITACASPITSRCTAVAARGDVVVDDRSTRVHACEFHSYCLYVMSPRKKLLLIIYYSRAEWSEESHCRWMSLIVWPRNERRSPVDGGCWF